MFYHTLLWCDLCYPSTVTSIIVSQQYIIPLKRSIEGPVIFNCHLLPFWKLVKLMATQCHQCAPACWLVLMWHMQVRGMFTKERHVFYIINPIIKWILLNQYDTAFSCCKMIEWERKNVLYGSSVSPFSTVVLLTFLYLIL